MTDLDHKTGNGGLARPAFGQRGANAVAHGERRYDPFERVARTDAPLIVGIDGGYVQVCQQKLANIY